MIMQLKYLETSRADRVDALRLITKFETVTFPRVTTNNKNSRYIEHKVALPHFFYKDMSSWK
jgi:hypothetical protein